MRLSFLIHLGFETTAVWDACPDFELSFSEVHDAAQRGQLVALLRERYGDLADSGICLVMAIIFQAIAWQSKGLV